MYIYIERDRTLNKRLSYMFVQRIKEHDNNDSVNRTGLMTCMYSLALSLDGSRIFFPLFILKKKEVRMRVGERKAKRKNKMMKKKKEKLNVNLY